MIPHQLHRLRHLSISGFRDDSASVLQLLTSPAPMMEHLTLRGNSEIDGIYVLSPTAFEGHAPMLHRLTLSNVRIPWYSPILSGLTHLHVKLSNSTINDSPPDFDPSIDSADITARFNQFFDALRAMPTLETLYLENCLPIKPARGADARIVSLPHLESLHLLSKSGQMLDILLRLDIPVSCCLSFQYDGRHRLLREDSINDFLPFLVPHARGAAENNPLLAFSVSLENHQAVFKFWQTCQISANGIVVSRPQTSPDITIAFLHWTFCIEPVQLLCAALPVESLRMLVVRGGGRTDDMLPRAWLDAFGRCQAVEHAVISDGGAGGFCRALAMPMDPEKASRQRDERTSQLTPDELFLPNLHLLELERFDFESLFRKDEDHSDFPSGSFGGLPFWRIFKDCLVTRSAGGGSKLNLAIRGCSVNRRQLEALKTLARVEWDGITDGCHDQR
ncbi:hypothetical protein EWM64_g7791 [Hericium alpestre]|uniref:F-box domain-containing protein n=1 Tax=Hericium alpestre TaxID=135208 RepID=A0A4Y9ZQW3_9AGAM|nr:hypothetical protein EWM64_g7791 [Hericium alpestre]